MIISKRLETIVSMIGKCSCMADIGCDHGIVSIQAVKIGAADRVIAADVAKGPLDAARRNVRQAGTETQTEFLLSDGLKGFPDDCGIETIVIAGMGGMLVKNILEDGDLSRFSGLKQLILGPQSDIELVRHFLLDEKHMCIVREKCVFDEGKYYFLFDVDACSAEKEPYSEAEYFFGRNISRECRETYIDFLKFRIKTLSEACASVQKGSGERSHLKAIELNHIIALAETTLLNAGGCND